jgi:hypothetical protein
VLPCLVVDAHTEFLFWNLIAFEQTCPQVGDDFTAYAVFMSQIVSMPEDVTVLDKKRIIVHHPDSDERVSDLFTMLSKDVVFDFSRNYYLKSLCQNMEVYYRSQLNRWMAWLWFNHFSNPWLVLAALATAVVLMLHDCANRLQYFGLHSSTREGVQMHNRGRGTTLNVYPLSVFLLLSFGQVSAVQF